VLIILHLAIITTHLTLAQLIQQVVHFLFRCKLDFGFFAVHIVEEMVVVEVSMMFRLDLLHVSLLGSFQDARDLIMVASNGAVKIDLLVFFNTWMYVVVVAPHLQD
jgi:hypothetical protein